MPKVTFAIAGSGPEEERVRRDSNGIENVSFLGKVNNFELKKYYSAADVMLIPSQIIKQTYEEGIPRVMIEGLSCGLPVISTKSGGIPDIFSEEIGYLVEDNEKRIMEKIQLLYKNRKILMQKAKQCRRFATKIFSVDNVRVIDRSLYAD